MEATSLQLFVLNQRTLTQWFNQRESTQELCVLTQGLAAEGGIAMASSQLPAPWKRLDQTPSTSGLRHEFVLPPKREGQAPKLRPGRRPASATVVRPIVPAAPLPLLATLPPLQYSLLYPGSVVVAAGAGHPSAATPLAPTPVLPATQVAPAPTAPVSVSRSTQRNRRRRAEEEATEAPVTQMANL
ncbi:hypothetical protein AMECASPLE_018806 [Ameca splendens]|uniref:Uncharacterized protein n=1 Tax=Ameca splendens TaxID=208324 RepID=A0ABV0Y397_9TELE